MTSGSPGRSLDSAKRLGPSLLGRSVMRSRESPAQHMDVAPNGPSRPAANHPSDAPTCGVLQHRHHLARRKTTGLNAVAICPHADAIRPPKMLLERWPRSRSKYELKQQRMDRLESACARQNGLYGCYNSENCCPPCVLNCQGSAHTRGSSVLQQNIDRCANRGAYTC